MDRTHFLRFDAYHDIVVSSSHWSVYEPPVARRVYVTISRDTSMMYWLTLVIVKIRQGAGMANKADLGSEMKAKGNGLDFVQAISILFKSWCWRIRRSLDGDLEWRVE